MTPFVLIRDEDPTGVSGTGVVAEGVEWSDGTVTLRWYGEHASTVTWASMASVKAIHGHDGKTRIVWRPIRPERSLLSAFAANGRPRPRPTPVARHAR
jgi:hypothetical protein